MWFEIQRHIDQSWKVTAPIPAALYQVCVGGGMPDGDYTLASGMFSCVGAARISAR